MLICGEPPFQEANDSETLTMILDCKYRLPPHLSPASKEEVPIVLVTEIEYFCLLTMYTVHGKPKGQGGVHDVHSRYLDSS